MQRLLLLAAVGPVTAGPLVAAGLPVEIPDRGRMGALVRLLITRLGVDCPSVVTAAGELRVRAGSATLDHARCDLSAGGLAVLRELASSPGNVVSRERLLAVLQDKGRTKTLQHLPYSMVSYAWGRKYQQSNQWALETLAMAMEPATVRSRDQAQAWLQFKGYEPTTLRLGPLTRLGGRVGAANVAFDDHPSDKRFADRIETVTVDSVLAWMPRAQLGSAPRTVTLP